MKFTSCEMFQAFQARITRDIQIMIMRMKILIKGKMNFWYRKVSLDRLSSWNIHVNFPECYKIAIKVASPLLTELISFSVFRWKRNVIYFPLTKFTCTRQEEWADGWLKNESKSSWLLRYLHCLTKLLSCFFLYVAKTFYAFPSISLP